MATVKTLRSRSVLTSPVTGNKYKVLDILGEGGFGVAYRALSGEEEVCLKVTDDAASWHREAYMAELLQGHRRVVDVYETFPILQNHQVRFAVAMELASGTAADLAEEGSLPEETVVRNVVGLLDAVGQLHASGAVHRDITPFNVFVCGPRNTLKLGDFGIARHGPQKGVRAGTFAPWFVDTKIREGAATYWNPSDDLWQLGQLAAVLLTGEVSPISTSGVRYLPCSDTTKYVIRRAIGEGRYRFPTAAAMSAALRSSSPLKFSTVRSLAGKNLVFTGPLGSDLIRSKAKTAAEKRGAQVLAAPSAKTDILVVGHSAANWMAGDEGGVKILEAIALQELGHSIKMITGTQFRRLAGLSGI